MKKTILIALLLVFSVAAAGKIAVAKDSDAALEKRKAAILKASEEKKACIESASDLAAISACNMHDTTAVNPMQQMEDDFAAHFKEHKENALKTLESNLKRMQKEYDCAKSADDVDAIKACSMEVLMMGNAPPMGAPPMPAGAPPAGAKAPGVPPGAPPAPAAMPNAAVPAKK
jgi:hypothetical protein